MLSIDAEIRKSAEQIYASGMQEAMRAAALMIVSRKLDEIRSLLVVSGLSSDTYRNAIPGTAGQPSPVQPSPPAPPPVAKNPCVQCGRPGVYRTKPNQFNRTGSWYCRAHMALGTTTDAEDRMDRAITPVAPPVAAATVVDSPIQGASPGAGSLQEAMGLAEVVNE